MKSYIDSGNTMLAMGIVFTAVALAMLAVMALTVVYGSFGLRGIIGLVLVVGLSWAAVSRVRMWIERQ